MLRNFATFPHAGCRAFLAPDAAPVRIIRHNADGTSFIAMLPAREDPRRHLDAGGNRTVPFGDLHPTATAAVPKPKRRRKAAA